MLTTGTVSSLFLHFILFYCSIAIQLPTSADNVALPAFAAAHRSAARLLSCPLGTDWTIGSR